MMRVIGLTLLLLFSNLGLAQIEWSYSGDPGLFTSFATSPVERIGGGYLATLLNNTTAQNLISNIAVFNEIGSEEIIPTWTHPNWRIFGYRVFSDPENDRYHLWTGPFDVDYAPIGSLHVITDSDFNVTEWRLDEYPDQARLEWFSQFYTSEGDMVFVSGMRVPPATEPHSMIFRRFSSDGDLLATVIYDNGWYRPREILQTPEGFKVLFFGADGVGPNGFSKVLRFDQEFNYLGGFALPDVNGAPPVFGQDSIPFVKSIATLPDGGTIVSAEYLSYENSAWIPILMKFDPDGVLLDTLLPPPRSTSGRSILGGLKTLPSGDILWVYEEDESGAPSVNQFVTVDADLNVISRIVLDGFQDNSHVTIHGVTHTNDGGLLIAGTKTEVGQTSTRAYIAKLGAFSSVVEVLVGDHAQIYPNPGSSFTAQLGLKAPQRAMIELYGPQGGIVRREEILSSGTMVDCSYLSSGLYHYRITDRKGAVVGSGSWVRE